MRMAESIQSGYIVPLEKFEGELFEKLMQYKIYDFLAWEKEMPLMLDKWKRFSDSADEETIYVFNCCLLQNPMCETMMRFGFSQEQSMQFISRICEIIRSLHPVVVYLKNDHIAERITKVAEEREGWLDAVIDYHVNGAYGKSIDAKGFEGYISCLEERQKRELAILSQIPVESIVLENPHRNWEIAYEKIEKHISFQTKEATAKNINILGQFCGKRDVKELTSEQLWEKYGIRQADVMVLFGGSIISGGDVLAKAIQRSIAKKYIIVGGAGHTTETLRKRMHEAYSHIETSGLSEAQVFSRYLQQQYGLKADYLEQKSTNCGNNITYLLELLKENGIVFNSIIISQDATMQHRMEAGLRKYVDNDVLIINYAVYAAKVIVEDGILVYEDEIRGMWDMDRYISLLLGEIPRLSDNEKGYGPGGKNFIAHVDIPEEVENAFNELCKEYAGAVREANPSYA